MWAADWCHPQQTGAVEHARDLRNYDWERPTRAAVAAAADASHEILRFPHRRFDIQP